MKSKGQDQDRVEVALGDLVADGISGFTGVVTGISDYLYGCKHAMIAPNALDKDGKIQESQWFDEARLVVKERGYKKRPDSADVRAGGPAPGTPMPPGR